MTKGKQRSGAFVFDGHVARTPYIKTTWDKLSILILHQTPALNLDSISQHDCLTSTPNISDNYIII